MARKVTFTLDDQTVARIDQAAERLNMPKSRVVREAVLEYAQRVGRLSERERERLLGLFDRLVPAIPRRPAGAVKSELAALRKDRRRGGRRTRR